MFVFFLNHYSLKCEKESACDEDENESQVEDPGLSCHHNPAIAVEFIPPRENLPLPLDRLPLVRRLHWRRAASADLTVFELSCVLGFCELHVLCSNPEWRKDGAVITGMRTVILLVVTYRLQVLIKDSGVFSGVSEQNEDEYLETLEQRQKKRE